MEPFTHNFDFSSLRERGVRGWAVGTLTYLVYGWGVDVK